MINVRNLREDNFILIDRKIERIAKIDVDRSLKVLIYKQDGFARPLKHCSPIKVDALEVGEILVDNAPFLNGAVLPILFNTTELHVLQNQFEDYFGYKLNLYNYLKKIA